MNDNLITTLTNNTLTDSRITAITNYRNFRAIYDNDYDEIQSIIISDILNKLFSAKTIEKLRIKHLDIVTKYLNRQVSGIYAKEVKRSIEGDEKNKLDEVIHDMKIDLKMNEAYKKAKWFGLSVVHPRWRNNKLELDILTPDMFDCEPEKDIMSIKEIGLQKYDPEINSIYYEQWSKDEYKLTDAEKNVVEYLGITNGLNPYKILPFEVLRFFEGLDFWGEPDWSGYLTQIEHDIKTTIGDKQEAFQMFGVPIATNLSMTDGQVLSCDTVIKVDNVKSNDLVSPALEFVVPNIDWNGIQNNLEKRLSDLYNSKGLPASSSSKETKAQSGASKVIDELELEEQRQIDKTYLYYFEVALLNKIRTIWNYHNPTNKIPEGKIIVEFSKESDKVSVQDKIMKDEFDKKYNIKDEIDFIMEQGKTEAEAIEYYKIRKDRQKELGLTVEVKPETKSKLQSLIGK